MLRRQADQPVCHPNHTRSRRASTGLAPSGTKKRCHYPRLFPQESRGQFPHVYTNALLHLLLYK
ncbi:MAG: hypothetical protein IKG72_06705 [Bacillus sp. (in: Bacteria)]|nr:hypothetical protein [Bacillus sp. (in: firmicutes)]